MRMARAVTLLFAATTSIGLTGCGAAATPIAPTAVPDTRGSGFPTITRPARVFGEASPLDYPIGAWTQRSRFVLYEDGTFVLQTAASFAAPREYGGTYRESNGSLTFAWDAWSVAGPWLASATLEGDVLTVRYNEIMQLSDFENASYVRQQQ